MRRERLTFWLANLAWSSSLLGQTVFFDVTPITSGVPAPVAPSPADPLTPMVVVVPPGTVIPYQLGVFVQPLPADPNLNGLAAFNVDVLTNLGVAQPPLTTFDSRILGAFTVSPSLGFPQGDDILGIRGQQDLQGFANLGVGLGSRQLIGTGQLSTPSVEGDFEVSASGTADLAVSGVNPFAPVPQPATVGTTRGFVVQTRLDAAPPDDTPEPPPTDDEQVFAQFGASLVTLCFPGLLTVLPACLLGLLGMRWYLRNL